MTESLRQVGKYEVIGILGRGSMGVVYKGRDPEIGRIVALKTLRKFTSSSGADRDQAIERFKIEARSAGNLRHPNIITVFDVSVDGDLPYIVMDYVEGESLDQLILRHSQLPPALALYYLAQVAAGVDAAHKEGVIHRDLKPSNIIVDKNESCYVVDFGVAKIQETICREAEDSQSDEPVMGTPGYMSPEQILGKSLDGRTDLFSLAVVAFECFCGTRPFGGKDFTEVLTNIINEKPLPLSSVSSLPLTLEAEFERALAKDRNDRFQSAVEMVKAFREALGLKKADLSQSSDTSAKESIPVRQRKPSEWQDLSGFETSGSDSDRSEPVDSPLSETRASFPIQPDPGAHSDLPPGFRGEVPDDLEESDSTGLFPLVVAFIAASCIVVGISVLWLVRGGNGADKPLVTVSPKLNSENSESEPTVTKTNTPPSVDDDDIRHEEEQKKYALSLASLRSLIEDGQEQLLLEVLESLQGTSSSKFLEEVPRLLEYDSYRVRIETVKVLAFYNDPKATSLLVESLNDHDPLVRGHTAQALLKRPTKSSMRAILARYEQEDNETVRKVLKRVLDQSKNKLK